MSNTPKTAMENIFNENACFQRWLDVEASLARAQAVLGIIPEEVATEIIRKAKVEHIDLKKYREIMQQVSHSMVAMLNSWRPNMQKNAGEYIHLGVTSQDIADTATILALKDAHLLIFESLRRIEADLLKLAEEHADTIMAGRTHSIQALPITFGYKVAIWAREIRRNIQRLKECRKRIFVIQLSGAVGTMASFGEKGPAIQSLVAQNLNLGIPDISWHSSRDRIVEFTNLLEITAGTLCRIAQEVYLLMAIEVGEVCEPWNTQVIGSSTMPHKINPQMAEKMISLSRKIRYNASQVTEVMVVDHERNLQYALAEREALEDSCIAMGKLLTYGEDMAKNLTVYPKKMKANLGILNGLLQTESVMLELGKTIGKQSAYEIIHEDAIKAMKESIAFKQVLLKDARVNKYLTEADIDRILNPEEYIGLAPIITKDIVAMSRKEREED